MRSRTAGEHWTALEVDGEQVLYFQQRPTWRCHRKLKAARFLFRHEGAKGGTRVFKPVRLFIYTSPTS